ncbi:MAG: MFS transporter [Actinomycetota bacterium]
MAETADRARSALAQPDFRRLLAMRLIGQGGDGLFQVALLASVLAPDQQNTTVGLFLTVLVTALPFTILGPFVGVFIDRWPRRKILTIAPLVKAALLPLAMLDPSGWAPLFYLGALAVISVNRFHLTTAGAVVPRLVAVQDLLTANSLATVGGSLTTLLGIFAGGKIADAAGTPLPAVAMAAVAWTATSWYASRIGSDLAPMAIPESRELLRHAVRRILVEMRDGARVLVRTPFAIGPIATFTIDQIGQGIILTLTLVVFRDEFGEGIGSVSNVVGASGVGVFLGIVTVGALERRLTRTLVIALSFAVGGAASLGVALYLRDWSLLVASFFIGLAFAWKKIPTDTMVQESLPDGYRGRTFAIFDVSYNAARILAAGLAIAMVPTLGTRGSVAVVAVVFLASTPVLPLWLRGLRPIDVVFAPDGHGPPLGVRWGGAEEKVEVLRDAIEDRDGARRRLLRVRLEDGSVLDLGRTEPAGIWEIERERDEPGTVNDPPT